MSLNKVQLIGNLTRDPEVRQIPGGAAVASFGMATNMSWTDQSGQKQDKAEFHNIVAWRKLAEICGQYLKKGMKVYIEGRIQTREWEAEDGTKKYRTEIVAENMIMLDRKGDFQGGQSYGNQAEHGGLQQSQPESSVQEGVDMTTPTEGEVPVDDLPF
ncbi:MAG TPA: single-stranded DNA-binding protein [Candidatus Gracilibacteria bacterium]|nr:single-stranded DNA-binding protein [Candidatus Gracilibacteria bacterium]